MTARRVFIIVLTVTIFATITWFLVPAPVAVRSAALLEAPWTIPVQPVLSAKEALSTLNSASLWGKLADISATSDVEPAWRFVGAMARGAERHVIIKKDNQPEQTLAPGDILPGGSKILSIENDRLCLLINGKKRSLFIYAQGHLSGKMSYLPEERAPVFGINK